MSLTRKPSLGASTGSRSSRSTKWGLASSASSAVRTPISKPPVAAPSS